MKKGMRIIYSHVLDKGFDSKLQEYYLKKFGG